MQASVFVTLTLTFGKLVTTDWLVDNAGFVIDVEQDVDTPYIGTWINLETIASHKGQQLPLHHSMGCEYILKEVAYQPIKNHSKCQ